jgi:septum formation protein
MLSRSSALPPLWSGDGPLILASTSSSRLALLKAVGLEAEVVAPGIDERALERRHFEDGGSVEGLASVLARVKALAVSAMRPDAYCLGADQTLAVDGLVMHKSHDIAEAAKSLSALAGKTHRLVSAFCVARRGAALFVGHDHADLRMRPLDPETISRYLSRAGVAALSCVGAYQVEGLGAHLFDRVDGENAVVLGLPMLKLLAWLRHESLISL